MCLEAVGWKNDKTIMLDIFTYSSFVVICLKHVMVK